MSGLEQRKARRVSAPSDKSPSLSNRSELADRAPSVFEQLFPIGSNASGFKMIGRHRKDAASKGRLPSWKAFGARVSLLIIFIVDCIVNNLQGFALPRRWIVGHGPSGYDGKNVCPYDYEGSWAIGLVKGRPGASPVAASTWQELMDSSPQPTVSCATMVMDNEGGNDTPRSPASFVADPFLFRLSNDEWYLFFEYKDVAKYIGELGVAVSHDRGKTFKYKGTVLAEPNIHLSYPHVMQKRGDSNVFQMVPETNQASQVRVYETTKDKFPFGWKLKATPLKGKPFVDTSIVWHTDRYFIFTSTPGIMGRSLLLFTTTDLTENPWKPHPSNPIVKASKAYGRSAGRPIVYKDNIYRFAQDGTHFYGEAVHILRAHVLTATEYKEQHVATIHPSKLAHWTKSRLHHMDVHHLDFDEEDNNNYSGQWMAFFDADPHTDYDEFMNRESSFYYLRKVILSFLAIWVLGDIIFILHYYDVSSFFSKTNEKLKQDGDPLLPTSTKEKIAQSAKFCSSSFSPKNILFISQQIKEKTKKSSKWKCFLYLILSVLIAVIILVFSSDMKHSCIESNSHPTAVCFSGAKDFTKDKKLALALNNYGSENYTVANTKDHNESSPLLLVTAASTSFMIRVRNLVGSLHYWEPDVHMIIYDIGFSKSDLEEMSTWKRCTVVPFPFDSNPPHVKLLYNFAWKIVLFRHALDTYGSFMYLDAGLEVLRPLEGVRHYLKTDGYFSSIITNFIGRETHPSLYGRIDTILERNAKEEDREFIPMDTEAIKNAPFCAGGIQGFVKGSRAESLILKPALECALDEHCIAPPGSGRNNHNYDQSVLATLAHASGLGDSCHDRSVYCSPMTIDYTIDETRCNGLEIAGRRWRGPRRYPPHIDRYFDLKSNPKIRRDSEITAGDEYRKTSVGTVEVRTGKKPQANSKWQKCQDKCTSEFNKQNGRGDGSNSKARKTWEKCLEKCPRDVQKQFWDSDKIDVVVIEYFSYWLKGIMFGCANYRLHTFFLSSIIFILLIFFEAVIFRFIVGKCCCCFPEYIRNKIHLLCSRCQSFKSGKSDRDF